MPLLRLAVRVGTGGCESVQRAVGVGKVVVAEDVGIIK